MAVMLAGLVAEVVAEEVLLELARDADADADALAATEAPREMEDSGAGSNVAVMVAGVEGSRDVCAASEESKLVGTVSDEVRLGRVVGRLAIIVLSAGTKLCNAGRFEGAIPLVKRLCTAATFDDGMIEVGIAKESSPVGTVNGEARLGRDVCRLGMTVLRAGTKLCNAGRFEGARPLVNRL